MSCDYPLYTGNCPRSVNRDAKYVIRSGPKGRPVVAVTYMAPNGEQWLATTEDHPRLVDMVNDIKIACGGMPNGPFYINEFRQVIVPVGHDATYYLAGEYDRSLEFEFEGNLITGRGVDSSMRPLSTNDTWPGPHPGIPYVLEPGMRDIHYDSHPRPNVRRRVKLSAHVGAEAASETARRIGTVKGWQGGRFYVNEWREIFAPLNEETGVEYRYIGSLEDDAPWFPKPMTD